MTGPMAPSHAGTGEQIEPRHAENRDIFPIPTPPYYAADQLTKQPQPISIGDLETPETAVIVASGKLIVKLWIDDEGAVADAQVEDNDLPAAFAQAAVAAFKNSRFAPGEIGGVSVGAVIRIEVRCEDLGIPRR